MAAPSQRVISSTREYPAHLIGYRRRGSVIVLRVYVRQYACACVQAAGWVRLANCLKAALLLAAVLASWQKIKSRAGAVYVTWGRASDAFQQRACLSLSVCLHVCLTHALCLWDIFLSVCGPVCSSCLVSLDPVCMSVALSPWGGLVRESTRFLFFFCSGPWNS